MASFAGLLFSLFILLNRVRSDDDRDRPDLNQQEKDALLAFMKFLQYHDDSYIWDDLKHACTTWKGVECDPSHKSVLYLRLPAARLIGKIQPGTIGKLTSLRVLSLHNNALKGDIPSDISGLKNLRGLYLHNNSFSGQLPEMAALNKLDVSNNTLSGPIPKSLSKFPESAFSLTKLCGDPLPPCNGIVYPPPPPSPPPSEQPTAAKKSKKKHLIIGISVGSGLLLVFLLCCLRKKMYPESKQPTKPLVEDPVVVTTVAGTSTERGMNKLVSFDDRINNYDVEELLGASAELLGRGSFGRSYKRVLEENKMIVVLKQLKDVAVSKDEFESKMEVLGKLKNENVVPLRGYCYSDHEKWLVYDYMPAGSLSAHLHGSTGSSGTRLDWNHLLSIALGAARGLAYLHTRDFVHGNIKSSNIFLRQETSKDASVSDYGLNTLFGKGSSANIRITGYLAPEVLTTGTFSFTSDVYSFGVLLLELLTCKAPNKASSGELWNEFHMWVQLVVREERKDEVIDVELRRDHQNIQEMFHMLGIIKNCVSIVPHVRPTMQEVVSLMEKMLRVETDHWPRQSSDDPSKGYDDTPSTDTRDTLSTRDTPSTITP